MRSRFTIAPEAHIPLFAEKPSHPSVPLRCKSVGARSEGPGWPTAGACALPLTAASALAVWRPSGDPVKWRYAVLIAVAALSICAGSNVAIAQSAPAERTATAEPHAAHIAEASRRFGIPEHWIRAVMRVESAGNARAVSSAGAMGLMQVMPETWAGLRIRHRLGRDPFEPRANILAGAAYLREMWDRYGNVAAMLAAYNAGPGRYDEYLATGRRLPAETRAYVAALAPILGAEDTPDGPPRRTVPPPDWREAPLFVLRPDNARNAEEPQNESIFVADASGGGGS